MFLAVDIGNTQTVLGLYAEEEQRAFWRLGSSEQRTSDELALQLKSLLELHNLDFSALSAVAIASVVPALTRSWQTMARHHLQLEPLVITPNFPFGIKIELDNPQEVGADRVVNAIAAFAEYKAPLIVVDLGTATTFDCVDVQGNYLGGSIAPGIKISMESLFYRASKLTNVPWEMPAAALGKNTAQAMQSGLFYGFGGQVDGLVRHLKKEMGGEAYVIATGGLAHLIRPACETIDVVDVDLTLKGLRILWQRGQK